MLKQCHPSLKRGPMNKSGDANRSVRNTKAKLRASMLALMQQKPVNEITVKELAAAMSDGVDAAYKAVMKPAEGTILTVSRACR